ncbi:MAG: helix-turn-helix domain-containing protein, partial [Candidatus Nanoarchaeia archaeon]
SSASNKSEVLPKDTTDSSKEAEALPPHKELRGLTAQELLDKSSEELEDEFGKREAHNLLRQMKIITAILLGKKKNKELAQVLDTDKSFTSKQIKSLEEQGLVKREGEGKDVTYEVDKFNVMKFLQSKVIIKWGSKPLQSKSKSNQTLNLKDKIGESEAKNGK